MDSKLFVLENYLEKIINMYIVDININLGLLTFTRMTKDIGENPSCPDSGSLDSPEFIRSLSDHEILDLLYHTYSNYIYTVVRTQMQIVKLIEEDINDCFSYVILKIAENNCKKVRQFRGESTFKTYLMSATTSWTIRSAKRSWTHIQI